ncbi:winged helix-turn-helix transcriptional regulator [Sphingomonas desiccabilis]|uniref:Transcriptional regulator n=1 Tax=Sphingomonas desiccabilis TaxID=429134 RepID=A0A4Q2INV5_9SPHN|nr:helix-turn-helix domain-containing protein [Sphingomonas desiccabilis]MBB3911996.1 DNA-binding HxlR family transcriptional regulator [Sphingomonas desiccabilis]RXZ31306.1 transcriptional regulator [Sphingomonas desiccabilis]
MDEFPKPTSVAGDVMRSECRARAALALLAEKWVLLVIEALSDGPKRTGALRRQIGGISEKMLIQTLRRLEAVGLIARHDFREVPPRVEYTLTERGRSLSPIVLTLDRWVEAHAFDMLPRPPASPSPP